MKHTNHNFASAGISAFIVLAILVFASLLALPSYAQDTAWRLDPQHSTAQLFMGAGTDPVNIGVAQLEGEGILDGTDPAESSLNFTVDPGQTKSSTPDSDEISFRSKSARLTQDGNLELTGDLKVTRLVRSIDLDPNESYYGATYGDAAPVSESRQVTFVVPAMNSTLARANGGKLDIAASTSISREQFPALFTTVAETRWPSVVVQDENCQIPMNLGEGYSGAICTGTPVEQASNGIAPANVGEGYYGFEPAAIADSSSATIVVHLAMMQTASGPSRATTAFSAENGAQ